jgi:hypothetical protein
MVVGWEISIIDHHKGIVQHMIMKHVITVDFLRSQKLDRLNLTTNCCSGGASVQAGSHSGRLNSGWLSTSDPWNGSENRFAEGNEGKIVEGD